MTTNTLIAESDASPSVGTQSYVLTLQGTGGGGTVSVSRIRAFPFLAKR
jgi:hypothetical protein